MPNPNNIRVHSASPENPADKAVRTVSHGYTLVEVVLAVMMFAVIVTVFMVFVRENDALLTRVSQYGQLDMQMDVLTHWAAEGNLPDQTVYENDPFFHALAQQYAFEDQTTAFDGKITMAVEGLREYTLSGDLITVTVTEKLSAREQDPENTEPPRRLRSFQKRTLVIDSVDK